MLGHLAGALSRGNDFVRANATDILIGTGAVTATHFDLFGMLEATPHYVTLWGGAALVVWRLVRMFRGGTDKQ